MILRYLCTLFDLGLFHDRIWEEVGRLLIHSWNLLNGCSIEQGGSLFWVLEALNSPLTRRIKWGLGQASDSFSFLDTGCVNCSWKRSEGKICREPRNLWQAFSVDRKPITWAKTILSGRALRLFRLDSSNPLLLSLTHYPCPERNFLSGFCIERALDCLLVVYLLSPCPLTELHKMVSYIVEH